MSDSSRKSREYNEESKMKSFQEDANYYGKDETMYDHEGNIISKLYEDILSRLASKGQRISQPLAKIYHSYIDEHLQNLKEKSQEVISSTKEYLTFWLYNVNIYSYLVGLWVLQNNTVSEQVSNEDQFIKSFTTIYNEKKKQISQEELNIAKTFYNVISKKWPQLSDKENSGKEIKAILIEAVAETINQLQAFNDNFYSGILVKTFDEIIQRRRDLLPNDQFVEQVKKQSGQIWKDDAKMKAATIDFYTFAKRFTIVDLAIPITKFTTKDVTKALINHIYQYTEQLVDNGLDLVDNSFDKILEYLEVEEDDEKSEELVPADKTTKSVMVFRKGLKIGKNITDRSVDCVTNTRIYKFADSYIHFKQRIDDLLFIMLTTYDLIKAKLYQPTSAFVKSSYDSMKQQWVVRMQGVNMDLLKEKVKQIKMHTIEGYETIQDAYYVAKDKVLEIRFDNEHVKKYKDEIVRLINKLYAEVITLDVEQIKKDSQWVYQEAVKALKQKRMMRAAIKANPKTNADHVV